MPHLAAAETVTMPIAVVEILEATTGGTRRHLVDLTTHLDRQAFDVTVICDARRDPLFLQDIAHMREQGVDVRIVPMVRHISPFHDLVAFLHILHILRSDHFDVVHTHSAKAGVLGRLAARRTGVRRVIHTPHVFPFQMHVSGSKRRFYRALERFVSRFTDSIICVSSEEEQCARHARLTDYAPACVIPNGIAARPSVDPDDVRAASVAYGLPESCPVVGTVGRFTPQKGYRFLLDAVPPILREHPETRFLFVGEGRLRGALETRIAQLGISDRVCFAGAKEDIYPLLSRMDVFVLPSLWEGLPYALLEAMQMGKAVVATAVGGVKDVIQTPETGCLVPAGDSVALAAAITALLSDSPRREIMGAAAQGAVGERYYLEAMVSAVEALYKDA